VVKLAAAMIGATILLFFVNKRYGRIKLSYDPVFWRQILKQSIPMGVSLILIQIYYTFDTVMLGFMKGEAMVGWYNAAYKIVLLFIGFATLFGTVIFPVLSRYYKESLSQLRDLLFQSSRLTLFFALPIAVGGMVLSSQIIQLVYGLSYQPSVLPLKILIWSVFTVYFNCSFAFCLLACDKQKEYMYSVLAGAIVNLILNFLLIPKYDMLGASIATITCETITLALILFYSRRIVRAVPGAHLLRTLSASAAMGMVLYFVPLNLWLKILVGLVTYLLIMITIKGIKAEDIISFQKILRASHDSR
jgi:O-antigen/teichoic acid export membrane protein